jgi:hypothetical protein
MFLLVIIDEGACNREGLSGLTGTELLQHFAETRPLDFAFLKPHNLINLNHSAFEGIPEWDAFAQHYAECELCNA